MDNRKDITDSEDVELLVNNFYDAVRQDADLAPVFLQRIPNAEAWPHHLKTMCSFWETVLFAKAGYRGNPFPKHIGLGINKNHFATWIRLFQHTVDVNFKGPKAEEAKEKAEKMRLLFEAKLDSAGSDHFKHLV